MGEVIQVHFGGAGTNIGYSFLETISKEHGINMFTGEINKEKNHEPEHLNVLFSENKEKKYRSRTLFVDSNSEELDPIFSSVKDFEKRREFLRIVEESIDESLFKKHLPSSNITAQKEAKPSQNVILGYDSTNSQSEIEQFLTSKYWREIVKNRQNTRYKIKSKYSIVPDKFIIFNSSWNTYASWKNTPLKFLPPSEMNYQNQLVYIKTKESKKLKRDLMQNLVIDEVIESTRKLLEDCDKPQAIVTVGGSGGATHSILTQRYFELVTIEFPHLNLLSFDSVPSSDYSFSPLEPVATIHKLRANSELADLSILADTKSARRSLRSLHDKISIKEINNLMALLLSNLTLSLRTKSSKVVPVDELVDLLAISPENKFVQGVFASSFSQELKSKKILDSYREKQASLVCVPYSKSKIFAEFNSFSGKFDFKDICQTYESQKSKLMEEKRIDDWLSFNSIGTFCKKAPVLESTKIEAKSPKDLKIKKSILGLMNTDKIHQVLGRYLNQQKLYNDANLYNNILKSGKDVFTRNYDEFKETHSVIKQFGNYEEE